MLRRIEFFVKRGKSFQMFLQMSLLFRFKSFLIETFFVVGLVFFVWVTENSLFYYFCWKPLSFRLFLPLPRGCPRICFISSWLVPSEASELCRLMESFRLEKTLKIIESSHNSSDVLPPSPNTEWDWGTVQNLKISLKASETSVWYSQAGTTQGVLPPHSCTLLANMYQ